MSPTTPVPFPLLALPEPPPPAVVLPLTSLLPLLACWKFRLLALTLLQLFTELLLVLVVVMELDELGPVLLILLTGAEEGAPPPEPPTGVVTVVDTGALATEAGAPTE